VCVWVCVCVCLVESQAVSVRKSDGKVCPVYSRVRKRMLTHTHTHTHTHTLL